MSNFYIVTAKSAVLNIMQYKTLFQTEENVQKGKAKKNIQQILTEKAKTRTVFNRFVHSPSFAICFASL